MTNHNDLVHAFTRRFCLYFSVLIVILISLSSRIDCSVIKGKVVAVLDGDTIEVLEQNKTYRIRLDGIDCPEKSQAFGNKAKNATAELCFGKLVTANVTGVDKYDRFLAKVVLADGVVINEALLKKGLAWHYKQYNNEVKYATLEAQAIQSKVGLWSDKSSVAPWEYRNGSDSTPTNIPRSCYVGSINSNKYHSPSCQWAKKIKSKNLVLFDSINSAKEKGYLPCKVCNP